MHPAAAPLTACPAMQHPYTEAEIDAVVKVMREACGQTQGKYMVEFEQAFCAFTGAKHAFAVNNCTSALKMAAIFCHIQPGDEVIIPAYTFCASAIPFGDLGAKIVWADINPDTWTIDPDDIARKITPKTKAVVCVHLLGMPCDMKKIVPIARAHGLKVVEDCAQALDCRIDGQHVGTFGDFGCFSFHSAKTMTTLGEGGMFVCADDADAAELRRQLPGRPLAAELLHRRSAVRAGHRGAQERHRQQQHPDRAGPQDPRKACRSA